MVPSGDQGTPGKSWPLQSVHSISLGKHSEQLETGPSGRALVDRTIIRESAPDEVSPSLCSSATDRILSTGGNSGILLGRCSLETDCRTILSGFFRNALGHSAVAVP